MEDPRIPTGYGKICRQASENLTKRGHTVYSLAFNNTAPNLSVVNFQWGTVLPNISLSKNKELLFGDKDIIENAFKEFSIDSIIFCNDTHRFAYIKELPKNILSQSWFWHVCEADTYDWLGIDIFNRIKGAVFATKFTENYNKVFGGVINKNYVRQKANEIGSVFFHPADHFAFCSGRPGSCASGG